ncbi:MAG: cysteine synthase A, partial [Candidatus Omnitrophota bacterium]
MRYHNILETIGKTPIVRLNKIGKELNAEFYVKLESFNPLSCVKERMALSMIEAAEKEGMLTPGTTVVEPTSGNTGIGLAMVCAVKGYALILTMPETMSIERRRIVAALGARVVLTPGPLGMKGAIAKAQEIAEQEGHCLIPQQFKNPANVEVHRKTTAIEIWEDMDHDLDVFVAGVGTGGTITGVGEVLKEKNPDIKVIAVEPEASPVLSGGQPGPHQLQGIGAGFVPDILNTTIYDQVMTVKTEDAYAAARQLARLEGIFAGISSGAALAAA